MAVTTASMVPRVLAVVASLVFAVAGAPQALPQPKQRWIEVETEHFTLLGNASEKRVVRIGRNLEILRHVLASTTRGLAVGSAVPTKIYPPYEPCDNQ